MKRILIFLLLLLVSVCGVEASSIALNAKDVLWSGGCVAATVSLPFCREGAGVTLETFCATGGAYAACGGAGGGALDGGGAANKVAYWADADSLTYDTLFHFDPAGNNIGLGTATFGTGLTQGIALTHDTVNWPSTNIANTVQFYARDQDGGGLSASLFVKGEPGGITSIGDRVLVGNGGILLSSGVAIGGLQLETVGPSLQMSNTISVAHGMTGAGVATSTYLDMRPIVNTDGGIQIRGLTETNLALILSGVVVTDPVSTKSTTSDGAIKFELGKKFVATPEAMAAGVNLISVSDAFSGGLGTRWIVDNHGGTWQTSHIDVSAAAVPAISGSCGTSPSIVGSDVAGKLTTGTVAPTSCVLTFNKAWLNAPACMVTNETTANLARAVTTTTTVTLTGTFVPSDILAYMCLGRG